MFAGLKNANSKMWLGCWSFGGGEVWGNQSLEDSQEVVRTALANGVVIFDTAELYNEGRSEECLGNCLRGIRNKAIVATKAGPGNLSKSTLPRACERSLKRLRTDHLDLYQIHWPDRSIPLAETFGALERLRAEGKILQYGVCNFGVQDISAIGEIYKPLTNQVAYNLLFRAVEFGITNSCEASGLTLIAYSPLAQGLLTGKYRNADEVPQSLSRTRLFSCERKEAIHEEDGAEFEIFSALREIQALAETVGLSMEALAMQWLLQKMKVGGVVVGARNSRQIMLNLQAARASVDGGVLESLTSITDPIKGKLGANADMWRTKSRIQ